MHPVSDVVMFTHSCRLCANSCLKGNIWGHLLTQPASKCQNSSRCSVQSCPVKAVCTSFHRSSQFVCLCCDSLSLKHFECFRSDVTVLLEALQACRLQDYWGWWQQQRYQLMHQEQDLTAMPAFAPPHAQCCGRVAKAPELCWLHC